MAPNIFADSQAVGANNGTSWADAYTDIQVALDAATAGQEVGARNTFTLASIIDIDQNQGDTTTGRIKLKGYAADGTDDGTRFCLDGNGDVDNCLKIANIDYWTIENMEIKNANSNGLLATTATAEEWILKNIYCHSNGNRGANISSLRGTLINSEFSNNTEEGLRVGLYLRIIDCKFIGNGSHGLAPIAGVCVSGCLFHDNTGNGMHNTYISKISDCIFDGNADGVVLFQDATIIGCRFTNNSGWGIDVQSAAQSGFEDYNFFKANGSGAVTSDGSVISGGHSEFTGTIGYTDLDNDNFNLTASATSRRVQNIIDGINNFYHSAGFQGVDIAEVDPPATPTGLSALPKSDTQIDLSWDFTASADEFEIHRSGSLGGVYVLQDTVAALLYQDTGLTASTPYFYKILAKNDDGGSSALTSAVTATTYAEGNADLQLFDSALYIKLTSDSDLISLLTTYEGDPAVFANFAPEAAEKPYIVYNITSLGPEETAVERFNIYIDIYEYNQSRVTLREIAQRVEFILDKAIIDHAAYSYIRLSFASSGLVPTMDPRDLHYNIQFSARAGRTAWAAQLNQD